MVDMQAIGKLTQIGKSPVFKRNKGPRVGCNIKDQPIEHQGNQFILNPSQGLVVNPIYSHKHKEEK